MRTALTSAFGSCGDVCLNMGSRAGEIDFPGCRNSAAVLGRGRASRGTAELGRGSGVGGSSGEGCAAARGSAAGFAFGAGRRAW